MSLERPIEIGKFFKNRRGDIIAVTIKEFEGVIFADIRQCFTGEDGVTRPTKRGVALSLRKLEELAGLINKAIAKARELGLPRDEGQP